jgi:hypothetical protein
LTVLFSEITGKGTDEILFSGQDQLPGLISNRRMAPMRVRT